MTETQAAEALATMYRYRAMYRKFADLYKHDDPELSKLYASLGRKGTKKIREAESYGLVNLAILCGISLKETAAGERAALTEYFESN